MTEAAQQVEDLLRLRDRLPEVAELISKVLQPGVVLHDGEVALNHGVVLGVDVDVSVMRVLMRVFFSFNYANKYS